MLTPAWSSRRGDEFWAVACDWRKCKHCNDIGADLDPCHMFGSKPRRRGRTASVGRLRVTWI